MRAQWAQPPKAVSDPEFRQTTSGAHGSANRADCLPRGKPFGAPAGAYPLPRVELDAPTPARTVGLPPRRGEVLSFEAKESTKESTRHGDSRGGPPRFASRASVCGSPSGCPRPRFAALTRREKGFYCPFCRRGSQCRAQWSWPAFAYGRSALVLAFFRRQNGRAFFPPLPIAALLRRSLGGDEGQIARVGMLPRCPADFATQKADRVSKSCWPVVRAGGPIAQRRSVQANWQGIAPDPRAVAPVVPRR